MTVRYASDENLAYEEDIAQIIAEATQSEVDRHGGLGNAQYPWTAERAAEFRTYLETADGIETLIRDPYFLGLGEYVYPAVLADIIDLYEERKRRPINLVLYLEGIGCVQKNTYVNRAGYGIVPIHSLDPGTTSRTSAPICETIDTMKGPASAVTYFNSGRCAGKTITTRGGYRITCTNNHPLYVMTEEGPQWKKAEELKEGDYLGSKIGSQCFGSNELTADEAYLLGYCCGDGQNTIAARTARTRFTVHKDDDEFFSYICGLFEKVSCQRISRRIEKRRGNFTASVRWDLLRKAPEICVLSHYKRVPSIILQGSKECHVAFLSGLFDADGSVSKNGHPSLTSVSRGLVADIQVMLANLGIVCMINYKKTSWQNGKSFTWRLKVEADAHLFFERVGFRLARKQYKKINGRIKNPNIGSIPLAFSLLNRVKNSSSRGRRTRGDYNYLRGLQNPSKTKLQHFLSFYQDATDREAYDILQQLASSSVIWLPIRSIEDTEDEFVDIEVPQGHNFISNSIISHNSGKTVKFSICQWLQWFDISTVNVDPQSHFNLIPRSTIALINLSRTEMQARRVCFSEVYKRFQCPFMRDYFSVSPRFSREINIETNHTLVFAGSSSALSALGYNLYSGGLDEACFMEHIEDSKRAGGETYDAAEQAYNAIWDRMTSRFMREGIVPGFLVMFSSPRYPEDFMERKIRQAIELGDESGIFWRRRSTWSAKGKAFFPSNEFFYANTETLEEVPEDKAIASGKLLVLDHDAIPLAIQRKEVAGQVTFTNDDMGILVVPTGKKPVDCIVDHFKALREPTHDTPIAQGEKP